LAGQLSRRGPLARIFGVSLSQDGAFLCIPRLSFSLERPNRETHRHQQYCGEHLRNPTLSSRRNALHFRPALLLGCQRMRGLQLVFLASFVLLDYHLAEINQGTR
jgi:hypothetical protein